MSILKLIKQTLKITVFLASISILSIFLNQPAFASSINVNDLNAIANAERATVGLQTLNLNSQLNIAAQNKANHMFANNYWAHIAPDGMTPWTFINASGYVYKTAGENLAMNYTSSDGVIAGWIASPTHKANVMNTSFTDVGYAVVDGVLLGNQTTLVVAMYGSAQSAPIAVAEIAAPQSSSGDLAVSETEEKVSIKVEAAVAAETEALDAAKTVDANKDSGSVAVGMIVEQQEVSLGDSESKSAQAGSVAGIMSIIPDSINAYRSLNNDSKASILILSLLLLIATVKLVLFNLRDKNGNKYIWFRKQPIVGSTVLGLMFILTVMNGIGITLLS